MELITVAGIAADKGHDESRRHNTKMPYGTCKWLRHSFRIYAVSHNVPLNIVQALLGHANMSTTAIYVDAVGDERRALVARMWL